MNHIIAVSFILAMTVSVAFSQCNTCSQSSRDIILECASAFGNVKVGLNCKRDGFFSGMKCAYSWYGDLKVGDNRIPLPQFIAEDGRRFNVQEYRVLNVRVNERRNDGAEWPEAIAVFDFTKKD